MDRLIVSPRRRRRTTAPAALVAATLAVAVASCTVPLPKGGSGGTHPTTTVAPAVAAVRPGVSWQWQLSGTIDESVLDAVTNRRKLIDVDMETTSAAVIARLKAKSIVVICYFETGGWESYRSDAAAFPATVLGNPVPGYPDERYLDIRQRSVLRPIMTARLDAAAKKGCSGVEPDLDDVYTAPTGFPLTMADQIAYNRLVADLAHARGLSIGLKNGATADGAFETAMVGFTDWALNESCNQFAECTHYDVYVTAGKAVLQVEYAADGMTVDRFCAADNAANFDGLLKQSSESLTALPRTACREG